MQNKTVNILGEKWKIIFDEETGEHEGLCDYSSRRIQIKPGIDKKTDTSLDFPETYIKSVIRHEVTHAIIEEAGLRDNISINNEIVADFIGYMYPKIKKIFESLGVED